MTVLTDVREISNIAYGFMGSKALFAALDLNLFTRLAKKKRALEELAFELDVAPNRLETLLAACTSLGLVCIENGRYFNSPASEAYLVAGAPADFSDYYRLQIDRQIYPLFMDLDRALLGEHKQGFYSISDNSDEAGKFSRAQHSGSLGPAHLLAKRLNLSDATTLLDVAGGSGAFSITLCKRYASLVATILDFPNMLKVAAQYVAQENLEGRIELLPGNALEIAWPDSRDCVLISYLMYAVSEADSARLCKLAFDALLPGGRLVVHDFMVNDNHDGPLHAALWMLHGLFSNPDAACLSSASVQQLTKHAGFGECVTSELIPGITRMLVAQKPHS